MLLVNFYCTGITHDDCHITIVKYLQYRPQSSQESENCKKILGKKIKIYKNLIKNFIETRKSQNFENDSIIESIKKKIFAKIFFSSFIQ